jgi:hypothetical protein
VSLEQKPSGRFNKGLRKVRAAQAEARSLAIHDYLVRARAAVDALEQSMRRLVSGGGPGQPVLPGPGRPGYFSPSFLASSARPIFDRPGRSRCLAIS